MCRQAIGVELPVVISPLLRIVPQDVALRRADFGDVILTSANGARALADLCDVTGLTAFCVGDQTAEIATQLGMVAHSAHGAAADLIELIRRSEPKQPLLHARGQETRGEIAQALQAHGYDVRSKVLYAQEPCDLSAEARDLLSAENVIAAPLFSPRSARLFPGTPAKSPAEIVIFSMSKAVLQAYSRQTARIMQPPKTPDAASLCDLITAFYLTSSG